MQPYCQVSALLTGVFLLIAGLGVVNLVTPLRAKIEGFPEIAIGLLGSFYFGGMLAGAFAAPFIIRRAGPIGAGMPEAGWLRVRAAMSLAAT